MHKKTYTTEFAALFSVAFAVYQGHKSGVINPDLIGQMFLHSYEVATIICTTAFALGRKIYTKYFRKPKSNVVESIHSEGGERVSDGEMFMRGNKVKPNLSFIIEKDRENAINK